MLNSKIVPFWFSAIFFGEMWYFLRSWQWQRKHGSKGHRVDSNACCWLGLLREEHLGGTLLETFWPGEEMGLEFTPLLSGPVDSSCCFGLDWFKLRAPSPLFAAEQLPGDGNTSAAADTAAPRAEPRDGAKANADHRLKARRLKVGLEGVLNF